MGSGDLVGGLHGFPGGPEPRSRLMTRGDERKRPNQETFLSCVLWVSSPRSGRSPQRHDVITKASVVCFWSPEPATPGGQQAGSCQGCVLDWGALRKRGSLGPRLAVVPPSKHVASWAPELFCAPGRQPESHLLPRQEHCIQTIIWIWTRSHDERSLSARSPALPWACSQYAWPPAAGRPTTVCLERDIYSSWLCAESGEVIAKRIEKYSFLRPKGALKCQIKLNEILVSGRTHISCRWRRPTNSPNLSAPLRVD